MLTSICYLLKHSCTCWKMKLLFQSLGLFLRKFENVHKYIQCDKTKLKIFVVLLLSRLNNQPLFRSAEVGTCNNNALSLHFFEKSSTNINMVTTRNRRHWDGMIDYHFLFYALRCLLQCIICPCAVLYVCFCVVLFFIVNNHVCSSPELG